MAKWLRFLVLGPMAAACALIGCTGLDAPGSPRDTRGGQGGVGCGDAVEFAAAASPPPVEAPGNTVYVGSGDTFFLGQAGTRWGQSVEHFGNSYFGKIGIYTLDTQPP